MPQIRPISRSPATKHRHFFWVLMVAIVLNGLTTAGDLWKTGQVVFVRFITQNTPAPDEYKAPEKQAEWQEKRTMVFDAINILLIIFPIASAFHALVVICLVLLPRRNLASRWIQSGVAGLACGFDLAFVADVVSWEGLVAATTISAIWCDKLVSEQPQNH